MIENLNNWIICGGGLLVSSLILIRLGIGIYAAIKGFEVGGEGGFTVTSSGNDPKDPLY